MTGLPLSAYCSTKGGVLMLTKALATEWAKYNITVNAIGPAYFPSEMTQSVIGNSDFLETIKTYCPTFIVMKIYSHRKQYIKGVVKMSDKNNDTLLASALTN